MPNVSYDTLTIQINADSKNANKSISSLSKNLRNLEKTAEDLDTERLEEIKGLLIDIAKIDFSNVSRGLQDVVSALKTFNNSKFMKATQKGGSLSGIIDPLLPAKLEDIVNLPKPNWESVGNAYSKNFQVFDEDIKNIKQDFDGLNNQLVVLGNNVRYAFQTDTLDYFKQQLLNAGLNGEQVKAVIGALRSEAKLFDDVSLGKVSEVLKSMGLNAEEVDKVIRHLKTDTEKLGETGKKAGNKWVNAFKRIAFYRVIRRMIQLLAQSIKESMQALAEYSPEFSKAIGEIKSSFRNLANSIIVVLAPILQVISPILETINHALVDINNTVASAFGGSEVIQATKNVEDYNDALKKTKTTSLGIDELNVISQDDNKNLFETIKQADTGFMDTFKEGFSDILEVVKTISGYLKEFASKILPIIRPIIQSIFKLVSMIMEVVNVFINDTAEGVNNSLVSFVGFIGQIVDFVVNLVKALMPTIQAILKAIAPIINFINNIIESIFNFLTPIVRLIEMISPLLEVALIPLNAIISAVTTVFYIVKGIAEVLVAIITFQFDKIGNIFDDTVEGIKNTWSSFADSTARTWQTNISGTVQVQNGTLEGISGGTTSADVGQAISGSSITSPISYVSSSQGSSQETIVNVYLDSREIAKQVEIIQKNKGASTFNSEGLSYGK